MLKATKQQNTFHHSGIGNAAVTTGFPRLRSLITNNRNMDDNVLRLYLRKDLCHDEAMAERAARHLRSIYLEDLVVSRDVFENGIHPDDKEWFDLWQMTHQRSLFADDELQFYLPCVGRLLLHKAATMGLCTTPNILTHICEQIKRAFEGLVTAVPSPSVLRTPVILLFVTNDVTRENTNMVPKAFLQKMVRELPEVIEVNGVAGVTEVFVRGGPQATQQDDYMVRQGFVDKGEYFIETNGGDIIDCFVAAMELLDEHRSIPSNPAYAHAKFGVEACRQIMSNELNKVLAETSHVDQHHVTLLVDCLLQSGNIVSVTRQSQQKVKFSGTLDIATFEQGIKVMTNAALLGTKDNLQGTSARIAAGRPVKSGTGFFDLQMDMGALTSTKMQK